MKNKILAVLMALGFAGGLVGTSVTFAADATTQACKGKKAGDTVTVDGKDVKCPKATIIATEAAMQGVDIAAAYRRLDKAESDEDDDPSYYRRQGNKDLENVIKFEAEQIGVSEEVKTALESGANPEQVRQRVKGAVEVTGAAQTTGVSDDDKDVRQAREDILTGKIIDPRMVDRKVKEIANKGISQSFGEAPEVDIADLTRLGDAAKKRGDYSKARDFYDQAIDATRNGGRNSPAFRAKIIAEVDSGYRPQDDLERVIILGTSVGGLPARTAPAVVGTDFPGSNSSDPLDPRGANPATSRTPKGKRSGNAASSTGSGSTGSGNTNGSSGGGGGSGNPPGFASRISGGDAGGSDAGQRSGATGKSSSGDTASGDAGTSSGAGSDSSGHPDGGDGGGGGGAGGGTGGAAGGDAGTGGGAEGGTGDGASSGGGAGGSGTGEGTGGTPGGGNPDQPAGGEGNTGDKDSGGTGGGPSDGGTGDDSPQQEPTTYELDISGDEMTTESLPPGAAEPNLETSTDPDSDQNYSRPFNSSVLDKQRAAVSAGKNGALINPVREGTENPIADRTVAVPAIKGGLLGNPGSQDNLRKKPATIDSSTVPSAGNTQGNIDPAPDATP